MDNLSKSQVNKLGDRIRSERASEADLRLLDRFRESFLGAYTHVQEVVHAVLGVHASGRAAKSVPSIVAKLKRDKGRLSEMQDIAGCRLVVGDRLAQDTSVGRLRQAFGNVSVVDRRVTPSHGYRAVHLIVTSDNRVVEIQIRTALQHLWAELSEKWTDLVPGLKYGESNRDDYSYLVMLSGMIADLEGLEVGGVDVLGSRQQLSEIIQLDIRRLARTLGREE